MLSIFLRRGQFCCVYCCGRLGYKSLGKINIPHQNLNGPFIQICQICQQHFSNITNFHSNTFIIKEVRIVCNASQTIFVRIDHLNVCLSVCSYFAMGYQDISCIQRWVTRTSRVIRTGCQDHRVHKDYQDQKNGCKDLFVSCQRKKRKANQHIYRV